MDNENYDWTTWNCVSGADDSISIGNRFDYEGDISISTKNSYDDVQTTLYLNRKEIKEMIEHLEKALKEDNKNEI